MRKPSDFDGHPSGFIGGTFRAVCRYVTDGDTFDFLVDLGLYHYAYVTVRLAGVDTPEIYRPADEAELEAGRRAREFVEERILGRPVILATERDRTTFGRFEASVRWLTEAGVWRDLADDLVAAGLGRRA